MTMSSTMSRATLSDAFSERSAALVATIGRKWRFAPLRARRGAHRFLLMIIRRPAYVSGTRSGGNFVRSPWASTWKSGTSSGMPLKAVAAEVAEADPAGFQLGQGHPGVGGDDDLAAVGRRQTRAAVCTAMPM